MARFTRAFGIPKLRVSFLRGLRFRLLLSYVFFFVLLLFVIGFFLAQTLKNQLENADEAVLTADWDAMKGYVNFEALRPELTPGADPEEELIIARLKQVYLFTDANGLVLDNSAKYASIGIDKPEEVRRTLAGNQAVLTRRRDAEGVPYLIKAGTLLDEDKRKYFMAVGRSLDRSEKTVAEFQRNYLLIAFPLLVLSAVLGWIVSGRAVRPLNSVAQAAQNITGSNLSLQIPLRGAGDELDHLIESFNRMTSRLHNSFEQIRRFSTDVSHELRTPLTAIRGQLEVALFTAETPEQFREAMANALEDVEKLSSIVRALLLLSQAESGQLALQKTLLDLGDVAVDVVDQFQIPAQEKSVMLTALVRPGAVVPADRTQIERLLSNLLSNAIKYTNAGGSVRVMVGPGDNPEVARLEVEDTGVGIAAENLPHIFDRFYRVRNSQTNQIQGLGLGLSFVSWIVAAHGGSIEVASAEGEGTRFNITLPRYQDPTAGAEAHGSLSTTSLH